jgi:hypothetical protein
MGCEEADIDWIEVDPDGKIEVIMKDTVDLQVLLEKINDRVLH